MALSANLKARLSGPGAQVAWLVDVGLPGGTRRYAEASYSPAARGHYEGKLLGIGQLDDAISDRSGTLQANEIVFVVSDTDRSLAMLFEGASAGSVVGSSVTVRLAEAGVAEADWSTRFTGVISNVGFSEPFAATIRARTDDLALRRKTPKGAWVITAADWPACKAEVVGLTYPLLYGVLSAQLYQAKGAGKNRVARLSAAGGACPRDA